MYVLSMLFMVLLFIVVLILEEVLLGTRALCNTVVLNDLSVQCTVCCIVFCQAIY